MGTVYKKCSEGENKGFSVLAVIMSIAFVGMLVMVVLYMALANYQMRQTGLRGTKSFYSAETALDEIKAGLQEKAGDALSDAYVKVLEQYTNTTGEDSLQKRKQMFEGEYVKMLQRSVAEQDHLNQYSLKLLDGFIHRDRLREGESVYLDGAARRGPDGSAESETLCRLTGNRAEGVILYGVTVTFMDAKGRTSIIETDLVIGVPDINFTQSSTMPDLLNMTLIAEQGLLVQAGDSEINGAFYAGKEDNRTDGESGKGHYGIELEEQASLTVSGGERAVTNGTVYLNPYSTFTVNPGTSLWARNIEVTSADLKLEGKTYLADDLTVNTAVGNWREGTTLRGSGVLLSGEFYGYGNPDSAASSRSQTERGFYNDWDTASLNSSIVINGADTTLDLSSLTKLMLAGNSYIGGQKITGMDGGRNLHDILTGESLTVKGGQIAYLVPSECLYDGTFSNPMTYEEYRRAETAAGMPDVLNVEKEVTSLGGRTLKSFGVADVKKIFSQRGYVYFYLDFGEEQDSAGLASEYFQYYWENQEEGGTGRREVERYLSFYASEENGIQVKSPDRYLRYLTNGNVLTLQQDEVGVQNPTEITEGVRQEQSNYQDIFYALNKKMINNYGALKNGEAAESGKDEGMPDRYVFDNVVNLENLRNYIRDNDGRKADESGNPAEDSDEKDGIYIFQTAQTQQRAYVVDTENGNFWSSDGSFHITKEIAEGANPARLVVCNGSVTVERGVTYRGIIISNQVVTLSADAKILSEGEEAAKVFQCQYTNGVDFSVEKIRPMDFFWDSVQYIINGAASGGASDTKKDVLDLSDIVTEQNWTKR